MAQYLRVLLMLLALALAGCTAPDEEDQSTTTPPTTTGGGTTPTMTTPTRTTPTVTTPTTNGTNNNTNGSTQDRMLTGVTGEARYDEAWESSMRSKLEQAGFTVVDSSADGATLELDGNTTIHIVALGNGTTLRMEFPSQPKSFEADDEDLEAAVDEMVEAAIPRFEEVAAQFESATDWTRSDTVWTPTITSGSGA